MANTTPTDVLDVIKSQHDEVKRLFTQVTAAKGEQLEATFCDLRRMLAIHETAEEEVVYPVLRGIGDEGKRVAEARTTEEAEATKMLARLEGMEAGSGEFTKLLATFRTAVLHHAESEEAEVFPLIRTQDADTRQRMATAFEMAEKAAPTHAHPHSGTSATSNLIAGPALAIMDRVRDTLRKT